MWNPSTRLRGFLLCLFTFACGVAFAQPADDSDAGNDNQARAAKLVEQAAKLYQANDLFGALRAYQRAWFWQAGPLGSPSPEVETPEWLDEIVPLAVSLDRNEEAIRYALLLPSTTVNDPPTLRRLALLARENRDWLASAQLQQRWLDSRGGPSERFERLLAELEIGRLRYLADDPAAASRAFAKVQQTLLAPTTPSRIRRRLTAALGGTLDTTWQVFGEAHLEAGRLALAEQAFGQADDTPRAAYQIARVALQKRQPLVAYDRLAASLDNITDSTQAAISYGLLDDIHATLNQPAQAINDLQRIVADTPNDLTAALMLGLMLGEAGQDREAEATLAKAVRRAIAIDNQDPLRRGLTGAARPDLQYDTVAQSAGWLLRRYSATGRRDDFLQLVGEMHAMFGALDDFGTLLSEAFVEHPQFTDALFARLADTSNTPLLQPIARAELAAAAGRLDMIASSYREAIANTEDIEQRRRHTLRWWRALLLGDHYDAAAEVLQNAIEDRLWPEEDSDPYFQLSTTLSLAEKPAEAFDAARQAADRAPGDIRVMERLGWALMQADRSDEALVHYQNLVKFFDPQTAPAIRDTLRAVKLTLSYEADERGDTASGEEWALAVLDEFPDNAGALNDLGYLWAKRGRHLERALRMTRRAVELEPETGAYWDSVAWAEHQLGKHDAALASVRQALRLQSEAGEPDDAEILDHLGDIFAALGRTTEAQDAWRRSADAYDQAKEAKRATAVREKFASSQAGD